MSSEEQYINQQLNNKPLFWSQKKWALTTLGGNIAHVDERNNQAKYIYAKIVILKFDPVLLVQLTDTMGTIIFRIQNPLLTGQIIYIPINHVFEGNVVNFTSIGFTNFSIGYQWVREDIRT